MRESETIRFERVKCGTTVGKMRIWLVVAAAAILMAALSLMGISGYAGWQLTHPQEKPITVYPADYGLEKKDVQFHSTLGHVLLKGWLIPGQDSRRIVIFAHGYRDNRSVEEPVLPLVKALHEQGVASLLFDFRNSGESEKDITSIGQFEKADLLSAIDYAKSLGNEQIGLIGFSMEAAAALMAAPEVNHLRFVVADSPFADLESYLRDH
ncbi:alpha/beta fold hydrolase [Kyrpidia sp.]|uniref:alpha/beta hydrolase n=1 Tax=Kyrpidia sp. TaxID=2073077 RepID=UPI00258D3B88|nr:alpha/beta fold hydrolase [Kyrpidia sp.]